MLSKNYTMEVDELFYEQNASSEGSVDPTIIFGPKRDSLYLVIPITIIYIIIFIKGLVGNVFTLLVIVRNKSMHTATNYYLFSLAISDLLLLVSGMPQEIYSIWSKWPYVFGATFCMLRGLAAETSTNASILTITLFTVERYLAICHPFMSHKMSKLSRASKHVVLLWIVAFGLALPQALQFGITSFRGVVMCLQTRVIIEHSFEISTAVFFLVPMVAITVLYSMIGLRLKRTSTGRIHKDLEGVPVGNINKNYSRSTRRVVKMLIAVVAAFFLCWAPFHAQRLVAIYGTAENHSARSYNLFIVYTVLTYCSGVFYYISTCINPILYHIMSNKFRVAFKKTVVRCLFLDRRSTFDRIPGSTVVCAYRGSNQSGNQSSGNKNTYKNRYESNQNAIESSSIKSSKKTDGKEEQDCNTRRDKIKMIHVFSRCDVYKPKSYQVKDQSKYKDHFCCARYCTYQEHQRCDGVKPPQVSTNNSDTEDSKSRLDKTKEFGDELAMYLEEVKERLLECEKENKFQRMCSQTPRC